MKAIKMFGLAALAALMAMAIVGASSAMAERTALCNTDTPEACEALTHVHETSVGKAKLLTSIGTTECNVLFLGDTLAGTSNPLVLHGTFTYTNCTLGGSSCTATEESGPAEIKLLKEGHETAKVTGEGLVHLVCGASIDCSYNGTGLAGTAKGPLLSAQTPDNGEVSLSEQATTKEAGGFLCPKSAKLDITTTPLEATYINGDLGYCAETEHTNGLYTNSSCTTKGASGNHEYTYALLYGPQGWAVNEKLCYHTLSGKGLWKVFNATGPCSSDDTNVPPASLYENGIIKTVE